MISLISFTFFFSLSLFLLYSIASFISTKSSTSFSFLLSHKLLVFNKKFSCASKNLRSRSLEKDIFYLGKPRPASWAEPSLPTPPVLIESTKESIKKDISHQGDKSKSKSVLLPGSPPEIAYAPPVTESRQTYYEGRTGTPFHNAVGTELKKTVRMDESTENTRRILTVEQTSRVIKFGDKSNKSYETSTNQHSKNSYNVPMPKKFVQGQFRESDYESDIDAGKIRPKWTPADSDTEEPRYRKVQAPRISRPRSIGPIQSTTPIVTLPSESENERSETDMRSSSMTTQRLMNDQSLKPGSPPEFGYSSGQELRQTANRKSAVDIIISLIFSSIASVNDASRSKIIQQILYPFYSKSKKFYIIIFVVFFLLFLILLSNYLAV